MAVRVWVALVASVVLLLQGWAAEDLQVHRFRFFIHPDLISGLSRSEVDRRLCLYVEDVNTVFARQTIRRFRFDPEQDVVITNSRPYSGHCGQCSETDFEVWAHVLPSAQPGLGSYGGFMAFDDSCAGVAADLHWDALYDRQALEWQSGTATVEDYGRQIQHLIHEIEHIFGAGVGEYYSLLRVADTTGQAPVRGLDYTDAADPFWVRHADLLADPLTLVPAAGTYAGLMSRLRLAEVTAAVINARVRWSLEATLPDLTQTEVVVSRAFSGPPVAGARVQAWKVHSAPPYSAERIVDRVTDGRGRVRFAWSGRFNNYDHLMLIKVAHPEATSPVAEWVSIYDAQAAKMLRHEDRLSVPLTLADLPWLKVGLGLDAVVVTWWAPVSNAVLEASSRMSPGVWMPVPESRAGTDTLQVLTVPCSGPAQFFRLGVR